MPSSCTRSVPTLTCDLVSVHLTQDAAFAGLRAVFRVSLLCDTFCPSISSQTSSFTASFCVCGALIPETCLSLRSYLEAIDSGKIANTAAPAIAIDYWRLPKDAKLRDVVLAVRADEAHHRDVNHFAAVSVGRIWFQICGALLLALKASRKEEENVEVSRDFAIKSATVIRPAFCVSCQGKSLRTVAPF